MNMTKAAEKVSTGQVTFAARDSEYDGHKIKEGDILAIENGKVTSVESDIVKAAVKITKNMVKKRKGEAGFITIIYGEDATEEQATMVELEIKEKNFIGFLLEKKYIYRDKRGKLLPYADKNNGLFEVKECFNEKTQWSGTQTLVTPKGRETFRLLYLNNQ